MDSVIYGALLSVCASNNQRKEAERYFEEMKSEGHSPNIFHYSSLLNAYSADGNCKKAEELIQEMKSAGLEANKVCFIFSIEGSLSKVICFPYHNFYFSSNLLSELNCKCF